MEYKLKTLKDFMTLENNHGSKLIFYSELREEGIKCVEHWLKIIGNPNFSIDENNCIGFETEDMDKMLVNKRETCASIGVFVNFLNITEEELKDAKEVQDE